jgi:hypothetical protein
LILAKSHLAVLAALADLLHVHLEIWPGEQPPSRIDAPSLILIAVISCLCLLASLWAAFSGADLSTILL